MIVVGSGWTGAWAAKQLSESGARVLVLEAGPLLDPDLALNEHVWSPEMRYRGGLLPLRARQPIQAQHVSFHRHNRQLFVDDVDHPFTAPEDAPFLWIRGRQVGGRSLLWMGATQRMSDFELAAGSREGHGVDWPISHADLAPHYATVERFLGVLGARDHLDVLPDGEFAGTVPMTEAEQAFQRAVQDRWPDRRVIAARGIPVRTAPPAGPGTWPRFTSVGSVLAAALATGNVTLRADAIVDRILTAGGSARAAGVRFIDRERRDAHERFARIVMLCGSTVESVRILLSSATDRFPQGPGNSSGLLGCCVMDHPTVGISGVVPGFENAGGVDELNGPNGIYIPRFQNLGERRESFAGGYGVWGRIQRGAPRPGAAADFRMHATCTMLPRVENRITIDPARRDAWGIPAVRIACRFSDNERAMMRDAERAMTEMIASVGGQIASVVESVPGQTIHEVGGARMGAAADRAVTDEFGRLWDMDNLFVTDGACWPTSGYQNPTLTMMAITVRACGAVLQQLRDR